MGYQLFTDATADVCPEMMASLPACSTHWASSSRVRPSACFRAASRTSRPSPTEAQRVSRHTSLPAVEFIPMEVELGDASYTYGPGGNLTAAQFYAAPPPAPAGLRLRRRKGYPDTPASAPGRPPPALLYTASRPGWCRKGRRRSTGIKYHPLVAGMAQRHPGKRRD